MMTDNETQHKKIRLLYMEDDEGLAELLAESMQEAGFLVEYALDGEAGLDKYMDGMALFNNMQSDNKLKNIPLIMQTGADSPAEVEEGIKAGVYYYLTKPYEEETILSLVKAAIRERKQNNIFEQQIKKNKDALGTFQKGEFHVKTPDECQNVAFLLGSLFPSPDTAVSGLYELIFNAIEHGNLGIGYEKKTELLVASKWGEELINRLSLPENANKFVKVEFIQNPSKIEVIITDQGNGFNP